MPASVSTESTRSDQRSSSALVALARREVTSAGNEPNFTVN